MEVDRRRLVTLAIDMNTLMGVGLDIKMKKSDLLKAVKTEMNEVDPVDKFSP